MTPITSIHASRRWGRAASLAALAALALMVGLSACGSSGGSSKASGPGETAVTTAAKGDAGSGGSSGKAIKVCDLLPVAQAAQFSGIPFTTATEEPGANQPEVSIASCSYDAADTTQEITVTVSTSSVFSADEMASGAETTKATKVAGVGDVAYYSSIEGEGLAVLYGDTKIEVTGLGLSQAGAIKVAEALHAKL